MKEARVLQAAARLSPRGERFTLGQLWYASSPRIRRVPEIRPALTTGLWLGCASLLLAFVSPYWLLLLFVLLVFFLLVGRRQGASSEAPLLAFSTFLRQLRQLEETRGSIKGLVRVPAQPDDEHNIQRYRDEPAGTQVQCVVVTDSAENEALLQTIGVVQELRAELITFEDLQASGMPVRWLSRLDAGMPVFLIHDLVHDRRAFTDGVAAQVPGSTRVHLVDLGLHPHQAETLGLAESPTTAGHVELAALSPKQLLEIFRRSARRWIELGTTPNAQRQVYRSTESPPVEYAPYDFDFPRKPTA
ncbi:MAG: hypothetical protein JKY37_19020 [Nannocystaceae bacterium]|nr:hypothetical protein [Nannocystaceae bacterium]